MWGVGHTGLRVTCGCLSLKVPYVLNFSAFLDMSVACDSREKTGSSFDYNNSVAFSLQMNYTD
jgi:hypothetical protein